MKHKVSESPAHLDKPLISKMAALIYTNSKSHHFDDAK